MALTHQRRVMSMLPYLLIATAAYAGAVAATAAVDYWLDAHTPQTTSTIYQPGRTQNDATAPSVLGPDTQAIFRRNLFGSETGAVSDEPTAAAQAAPLNILLRGTADIEGTGFGVFQHAETGQQDIFAVGEKIFDGPELVTVFARSAVILLNGKHKTIELSDAPARGRRTATAPSRVKAESTASAKAGSGVRKTGDGQFLVDRREVDHAIANLNEVVTQARAVPYMKDGKNTGFRVFAIRPGSIFEQIGLKNGDVVQRINDQQLSDPAKAAGLLDVIQSADTLRIDILRANKPSTMSYRIQ